MSITRGVSAAAVFAGVAVAAAGAAWADPPTMSGSYTASFPADPRFTATWVFTPCGPGCAHVQGPGNPPTWNGQAQLTGGQWALNIPNDPNQISCSDGSLHTGDGHEVWDANTLQGQYWSTAAGDPCPGGAPGPYISAANQFNLTKAS
jgi:hypothetical protein